MQRHRIFIAIHTLKKSDLCNMYMIRLFDPSDPRGPGSFFQLSFVQFADPSMMRSTNAQIALFNLSIRFVIDGAFFAIIATGRKRGTRFRLGDGFLI